MKKIFRAVLDRDERKQGRSLLNHSAGLHREGFRELLIVQGSIIVVRLQPQRHWLQFEAPKQPKSVAPDIKIMQGKMETLKKIVFPAYLPERVACGKDTTGGIKHCTPVSLTTN